MLSEKNFDLLCKGVECLSFRHSILRWDPKDLENFYYELLDALKGDSDIDDIFDRIRAHSTMRQEDKFRQEFIYATPKSNVAKMILDRIVRSQSESVNWSSKDIHLEHVMPQRPKDQWLELKNSDQELYEMSIERLGNLTLLQDKLNQGASNKSFELKKLDYYEKSRLKITKELTRFDHWDYDTIDQRQTELYEVAKSLWTV